MFSQPVDVILPLFSRDFLIAAFSYLSWWRIMKTSFISVYISLDHCSKLVSFPFHNRNHARVWSWGGLTKVTVDKILSFSHLALGVEYLSTYSVHSKTMINLKLRDILFSSVFQSKAFHDLLGIKINRKMLLIVCVRFKQSSQETQGPYSLCSSDADMEMSSLSWGDNPLPNPI